MTPCIIAILFQLSYLYWYRHSNFGFCMFCVPIEIIISLPFLKRVQYIHTNLMEIVLLTQSLIEGLLFDFADLFVFDSIASSPLTSFRFWESTRFRRNSCKLLRITGSFVSNMNKMASCLVTIVLMYGLHICSSFYLPGVSPVVYCLPSSVDDSCRVSSFSSVSNHLWDNRSVKVLYKANPGRISAAFQVFQKKLSTYQCPLFFPAKQTDIGKPVTKVSVIIRRGGDLGATGGDRPPQKVRWRGRKCFHPHPPNIQKMSCRFTM